MPSDITPYESWDMLIFPRTYLFFADNGQRSRSVQEPQGKQEDLAEPCRVGWGEAEDIRGPWKTYRIL